MKHIFMKVFLCLFCKDDWIVKNRWRAVIQDYINDADLKNKLHHLFQVKYPIQDTQYTVDTNDKEDKPHGRLLTLTTPTVSAAKNSASASASWWKRETWHSRSSREMPLLVFALFWWFWYWFLSCFPVSGLFRVYLSFPVSFTSLAIHSLYTLTSVGVCVGARRITIQQSSLILSYSMICQEFKPRIHVSESDFATITLNGQLCDADGCLGPRSFILFCPLCPSKCMLLWLSTSHTHVSLIIIIGPDCVFLLLYIYIVFQIYCIICMTGNSRQYYGSNSSSTPSVWCVVSVRAR